MTRANRLDIFFQQKLMHGSRNSYCWIWIQVRVPWPVRVWATLQAGPWVGLRQTWPPKSYETSTLRNSRMSRSGCCWGGRGKLISRILLHSFLAKRVYNLVACSTWDARGLTGLQNRMPRRSFLLEYNSCPPLHHAVGVSRRDYKLSSRGVPRGKNNAQNGN